MTSEFVSWLIALVIVCVETIGLDYLLSAFDIYSDYQLLFQYHQYAFDSGNQYVQGFR